jgi:hypothetical protein
MVIYVALGIAAIGFVLGLVTDQVSGLHASLAISLVCLSVLVLARRRAESSSSTQGAALPSRSDEPVERGGVALHPSTTGSAAQDMVSEGTSTPSIDAVPDLDPTLAAHVAVVSGRRRFHARDCPLLAEGFELVTEIEAREEGFSPCSRCSPSGNHNAV